MLDSCVRQAIPIKIDVSLLERDQSTIDTRIRVRVSITMPDNIMRVYGKKRRTEEVYQAISGLLGRYGQYLCDL